MHTGVFSGSELTFTLEPSDIIAVQEQPLMLHCQVDGIPPITMQWRRNGKLLLEGPGYAMFANGSLLISHFLKTKLDGSSDEGDYECMAQNPIGLLVSRKARLQAASKWVAVIIVYQSNLLFRIVGLGSIFSIPWYCPDSTRVSCNLIVFSTHQDCFISLKFAITVKLMCE